jgi:hypothetical protein
MSEAQRWNEQDGILWMEKHGLRLVLRLPSSKGYVRFVVIDHRDPNDHLNRLIGSGTLEDIGKAKKVAQRMAGRLGVGPTVTSPGAICGKAELIMVNGLGAGAPRRHEYLRGYCSRKARSACRRLLWCYAGLSGPSPCQNRTRNAPSSRVRTKSRPIRQMRLIASARSRRPRSLSGTISPQRPTRRQLAYARLCSRSVFHRAGCHISRPIAGLAARPPLASARTTPRRARGWPPRLPLLGRSVPQLKNG